MDFWDIFSGEVSRGNALFFNGVLDLCCSDYNLLLMKCIIKDRKNIIEFTINHAKENNQQINYNDAMGNAASHGQIDIVRYFLEKGANNYDFSLYSAVMRGHEEIIRLLIEKGANNHNQAIKYAVKFSMPNIVLLLIEYNKTDLTKALKYASNNGCIPIAQIIVEYASKNNIFLNYDIAISYPETSDTSTFLKICQEGKRKI